MADNYDKSKMQTKEDILRFEFGEYPAIGILHFEQRRDERTKSNTTDIFGKKGLSDQQVLIKCFEILEKDKYKYIKDKVAENKKKELKTEWIAAFQTDEIAGNGRDSLFIFIVFSIDKKETSMNGIQQGQECLICVTVVKDVKKIRHKLPAKTAEATLCYYIDTETEDEGEYKWRQVIPR